MYPGVPLVSAALSLVHYLAIPRSVSLIYPVESTSIFSGLISLWMILLSFSYSKASIIHAAMNLTSSSEKYLLREICSLKSPPVTKSIVSYKLSLFWNACCILIMNSLLRSVNNVRSLMTLFALFLLTTLILDISFIA